MKILVATGPDKNLDVKMLVERLGHAAEIAMPSAALEKIKSGDFDLIVTDQNEVFQEAAEQGVDWARI